MLFTPSSSLTLPRPSDSRPIHVYQSTHRVPFHFFSHSQLTPPRFSLSLIPHGNDPLPVSPPFFTFSPLPTTSSFQAHTSCPTNSTDMSTAKKNPPAARASALNPPAKTMKTSSPASAPNAIAPGLAAPAQAPNNAKSNRPVQSSSLAQQKTQPAKPVVSKIHDPAVNNYNPMATLPTQQGDAVKEKKENVSATMTSEYVPHRFQWRQGGANVMVTGTFDDWQQSIKLKPTLGDHLEAIVNLDRSKKILFKFVVDGHWHCSDEFATESDPSGNQNNILPPIKV